MENKKVWEKPEVVELNVELTERSRRKRHICNPES